MNQRNIHPIASGKLIALAVFLLTSLSVPIQTQARDFSTSGHFSYEGTGNQSTPYGFQARCSWTTATTSLFVASTTPAPTQAQVWGSQCIQLSQNNIGSIVNGLVQPALDGDIPAYITPSNGTSAARGSLSNVTLNQGTVLYNYGTSTNITIAAGAREELSDILGAHRLLAYGTARNLLAKSKSYSATIAQGGMQYVAVAGIAYNATVFGGQAVEGEAQGSVIKNGGTQTVYQGALSGQTAITTATFIESGGFQDIISIGDTDILSKRATAYSTSIASGGTQWVKSGQANSTTVSGLQKVSSYQAPASAGSTATVTRFGYANTTTIKSGGVQEVFDGGVADITTVESGGTQSISNNGKAYGTKVEGVQVIASGGQAHSATISNGGTQIVLNGGLAYNTILTSGTQIVEAGGLAKDTILSAGSLQRVSGTLENSTIPVGATVEILPGGSATGNIIANGAFVFTTADSDTRTYTGGMTGNGVFKKDGGGTLIFNSVSPQFTGTTTIAGGILKLGDMYTSGAQLGGNIQVNSLGTLRGHGTVLGSVINQGTVMPGGSIGTLRIAGDYTQASNGKLVIEMSPTKVAKLKISGTANIDGGLTVVYAPGRYQTGEYNILSADKGVNGKFVNPDYSIPVGHESDDLEQSLLYSSNDVNVVLSKKQELDNSETDPDNPAVLVVAPKNTSIYPSLGISSALAMRQFTDTLIHKYGLNQEYGNDVWAQAIGSQLKQGNMRSNEAGMMFGINRVYGHTRLGVALSYGNTNTSERDKGSSASFDNLRLALYGNRQFGSVLYSGALSYNRDSGSSSRLVDPALGSVSAKQRASGTVIDLTAGLPMARGSFNVIPYVGIKHASIHMGASTEQGLSGYDLALGRYKLASTQMQIGSVLTGNTSPAKNASSFSLKIAYSRELGKSNQGITVASQDGMQFAVKALELPKNLLLIGGQFEFHPATKTSVSLGGQLGIGSNKFLQSTFNAKLKYEF